MSDNDDRVGYGRPPRHTRFKPGHSGNPKGRPRKSRDLAELIERELETKMEITEGGKRKRISKREAIPKRLVQLAMNGDKKPLDYLVKHMSSRPGNKGFEITEDDEPTLAKALEALASPAKTQGSKGEES